MLPPWLRAPYMATSWNSSTLFWYAKSCELSESGATVPAFMRDVHGRLIQIRISGKFLISYNPAQQIWEFIVWNFYCLSCIEDGATKWALINCTVFTHILLHLSFPVFYSNTFNKPGDIFATYAANICYICFTTSFMANEPPQMTLTIRIGAFPAGTIHNIVHAVHLLSSSHLFS